MDTIYALASARGKAGVAVIRISGPKAFEAAEIMGGSLPQVRMAGLRALRGPDGEIVDQALVICFAAGASFTGEEVVELHTHGSIAVVKSVLLCLSAVPGLRLAEAGEFTRRALENECLDLSQVEGLADLIEAETDAQRRQALRVLSGAIGQRADVWRRQLIRAAALLEATIDFADEDVPVDVMPEVLALLDAVARDLQIEIGGLGASERIRDGFEVAIVGPPNAGKSTLLNALAGRDAAITSEHAGTTRDVIEVRMDIDGLAVTFLDTAGLRESSDEIEKIGIARARSRANEADLRVFLLGDGSDDLGLTPQAGDIVLQGKADISGGPGISGKTGAGVPELLADISARLSDMAAGAGTITRERHRVAIVNALGYIASARNQIMEGFSPEMFAEELRLAVRALESLLGRIDVENILGEIFASFCIGK